jgi:hypothetical protein
MSCILKGAAIGLLVALMPVCASAGVVCYDSLAVRGSAVMLKARTKGRFLSAGGKLVRFYVEEASLGQTLSGGDGVAYMEFVPQRKGPLHVKAATGDEEDTCLLLALERGRRVVFVDVTAALMGGLFSKEPVNPGSLEAIKEIMKKYPVIYMKTELLGAPYLKEWLRDNGFPESPVLEWNNGSVLRDSLQKGLKIRAVIGGPSVAAASRRYGADYICFGRECGSRKEWNEIADSL